MAKLNRKLANGDYEIVIPSYLTFLNALKDNINTWTFDNQPEDEGIVLDCHIIGTCVKDAIEASRKQVTS